MFYIIEELLIKHPHLDAFFNALSSFDFRMIMMQSWSGISCIVNGLSEILF